MIKYLEVMISKERCRLKIILKSLHRDHERKLQNDKEVYGLGKVVRSLEVNIGIKASVKGKDHNNWFRHMHTIPISPKIPLKFTEAYLSTKSTWSAVGLAGRRKDK